MWTYVISNGYLGHDGQHIDTGYSGHPPYVNDVTAIAIRNVGPLPTGFYTFDAAIDSPQLGPCAIPLTPDPANFMFDRSGFFVHGDKVEAPGAHLASDGCMIFGHSTRMMIDLSTDKQLQVVAY
ncbi:MAG TPA: tlde1 domain-containing protein [Candidatus Acidoferrales bacterium]|nr:tlde1 domain-containing protein [Candidatus Acidoferrales bacterium]